MIITDLKRKIEEYAKVLEKTNNQPRSNEKQNFIIRVMNGDQSVIQSKDITMILRNSRQDNKLSDELAQAVKRLKDSKDYTIIQQSCNSMRPSITQ